MAYGNWRDYLRGREAVSLKKCLYVFRPLLACRWIERQLGQVPMLFAQLVESVLDEVEVRAALDELVARRRIRMPNIEFAQRKDLRCHTARKGPRNSAEYNTNPLLCQLSYLPSQIWQRDQGNVECQGCCES
jgi:predicted nucleotidyltransferase